MKLKVRSILNMDYNWKFKKGMDIAGFSKRIDDSTWEDIQVPHDWSIEGPFKEDNPSGPRGGYAPGGIAWYRKKLILDKKYEDKKIFIEFDGVYMNSEVYLNGERVGKYPYGYTSLFYDITPFVKLEEENLLSVKVDTSLQPSSRWYSGAGIYRHVRLIITDKLHFVQWGTYITTPVIDNEKSIVNIKSEVKNEYDENKTFILKSIIIDREGSIVNECSTKKSIGANAVIEIEQNIDVKNPILWSTENPYLYTVYTQIIENENIIDDNKIKIGIRTIEFDADKGFLLNGKQLKIKGVCLHHDGGALGAACPDRAIERQIQILQDMGCNAIRTSHNPPSPVLLDLCDRYGMLVMDEAFDEYRIGKRPRVFDEQGSENSVIRRPIYAYSEFFDEYHEKDLSAMVKRDRNHPCVIMWSIGNEIPEHIEPEGVEIIKELVGIVKKYDKTRPTVSCIVGLAGANKLGIPDLTDVAGYNYKESLYEEEHKKYPKRKIIGSETRSASPFELRGKYDNFIKTALEEKNFEDIVKNNADVSTIKSDERFYKAEYSWKITNKLDYIEGLFIWTGFDYIGEPTPFAWPSKTSYFGVIDTCGFPKDAFYMYQSQWSTKPVLHIFPHWNWEGKEGELIPVWCYTNCDSVELYLNGKPLGEKQLKQTEWLHLEWKVAYEKGILKAVGKKDGKIIITNEVKTTSEPYAIVLEADRKIISADSQDLSYITAKVVDKDKNLVSIADNKITFKVEGEGRLVGVDNGNSTSIEEYKGSSRTALSGLCLAIVQSTFKKGQITVKAESAGLQGDCIIIKTE